MKEFKKINGDKVTLSGDIPDKVAATKNSWGVIPKIIFVEGQPRMVYQIIANVGDDLIFVKLVSRHSDANYEYGQRAGFVEII